jgi:glycosyltransferase involved in cell wall biosynthesis
MKPIVSVIMPIYNAEKYLCEAVNSILSQTLSNFELIFLNDGSTDSSHKILSKYEKHDPRVVYKNFKQNRGLPSVLNDGIAAARGTYIARMDQDDISLPNRLQDQVSWMEAHPQVDICGTWVELIGVRQGEMWQHPVDHDAIHARMLFNNALVHPTVMLRTSSIRAHNLLYDEKNLYYIEDYELWSRALGELKFANLGQVLLKYRVHPQSASVKYRPEQIQAHDVVYRRLLESLQIQPSARELALHQKIANFQYETRLSFLCNSYTWLKKISRANHRAQIIPSVVLDAELNVWWLRICNHVFFNSTASSRPIPGVFRIPLGKINKMAYKLAYLILPGANSKESLSPYKFISKFQTRNK